MDFRKSGVGLTYGHLRIRNHIPGEIVDGLAGSPAPGVALASRSRSINAAGVISGFVAATARIFLRNIPARNNLKSIV